MLLRNRLLKYVIEGDVEGKTTDGKTM